VQSAWEEDLLSHVDFKAWQFISRDTIAGEAFNNVPATATTANPIVCFGSFQDYLGKNEVGGIKARNEWVHATNWDCVVFDEYHYGACRESAKELFEAEGKKELEFGEGEGIDYFDEEMMPITVAG
jgi:hypothetical protein